MTIEARLKWTDGLQFVARAGDGPAVVIDSTDGASGASPMQLLLMGIAGCTAIDIVVILKKKRLELTGFEVTITGQRAADPPERFTRLAVEYIIRGRGIKPAAVEQAIDLSENKYCSALASVNAEFEHTYRIVQTP